MEHLSTVDSAKDLATKEYVDQWHGGPTGSRNVIRNGDMRVSQRGEAAPTNDGRLIDGYTMFWAGPWVPYTRGRTLSDPYEYTLNVAVSGHSAATDVIFVEQKVEEVSTLAGLPVTLSFVAKAAAGTPRIGVRAYQHFGSGGSAAVSLTGAPVTISTTMTRYTTTFTMPSITGKTIGANDYMSIMLYMSAGANYAADSGSIGIQNTTFTVTNVQLEAGSTATPFERLPQQQQVAWCQRYFWRRTVPTNDQVVGTGQAWSATNGWAHVPLPVTMRSSPTTSFSAASGFAMLNSGGGGVTVTSLNAGAASPSSLQVSAAVASGLSAGIGTGLTMKTTAYIDVTAEL